MVEWLRLQASNERSVGSIPGQGIEIPHAIQCGQKKKKFFFKEQMANTHNHRDESQMYSSE